MQSGNILKFTLNHWIGKLTACQSELRQYIFYITLSDTQKAFKTVDICEQ